MRGLLFVSSFIALSMDMFAQIPESMSRDTIILYDPIIYPSFHGGQEKLKEYIKDNLKWEQGQETVEGKVFIEFFVNALGEIGQAKVVRGLCDLCDKAALRVIMEMPRWIPGSQDGKPMQTKMIIPVQFELD